MADEADEPFIYPCSLRPDVASRVQALLLQQFPALEITINQDRSTYNPLQAAKIPTNEVLVVFRIPRDIDIADFWEKVINSESEASTQRERGK